MGGIVALLTPWAAGAVLSTTWSAGLLASPVIRAHVVGVVARNARAARLAYIAAGLADGRCLPGHARMLGVVALLSHRNVVAAATLSIWLAAGCSARAVATRYCTHAVSCAQELMSAHHVA